MSGAHSRRKGRGGELEWVKLWGGNRHSPPGLPTYDAQTPPLVLKFPLVFWEVKRRKQLATLTSGWRRLKVRGLMLWHSEQTMGSGW